MIAKAWDFDIHHDTLAKCRTDMKHDLMQVSLTRLDDWTLTHQQAPLTGCHNTVQWRRPVLSQYITLQKDEDLRACCSFVGMLYLAPSEHVECKGNVMLCGHVADTVQSGLISTLGQFMHSRSQQRMKLFAVSM